jgi:hypothetical protein
MIIEKVIDRFQELLNVIIQQLFYNLIFVFNMLSLFFC